jgi:protein tyrosine phosphatase (PTP) superfamily phosphohydrolase (DUF442 family)
VTASEQAAAPRTGRSRRRWVIAALIVAAALAATWGLMKLRVFRAPYPAAGKAFARPAGVAEEAFNFAEVAPGVYRSARPDAAFVRHVHRRHGVRRIISLNGWAENESAHEQAWLLGIELTVFQWPSSRPPPADEVREALRIVRDADGPVWFHCSSGADRTGLLAACYRVREQGWPIDRAVDEMRDYWHDPEANPAMRQALERATGGE